MILQPFEPHIPEKRLKDLHNRLTRFQWPNLPYCPNWRYGIARDWFGSLLSYWRNHHDWRATERRLARYPHYRVCIRGQWIHFLHIRSQGGLTIPLLLVHGWPWTFLDFEALIHALTTPINYKNKTRLSFDLVIPSLPGFGFSLPLARSGLDIPSIADLFTELMAGILKYPKFAIAGGDFGAAIATFLAHRHPEVVACVLATTPLVPGLNLSAIGEELFSPEESWMLARRREVAYTLESHVSVHRRNPDTLACALSDSPAGTAAWLWERRFSWSDGDPLSLLGPDFLCDLASLYWLTGSIASSLRLYWEHFAGPGLSVAAAPPTVQVPCAFCIHPKEVMLVPRACLEPLVADLRRWRIMSSGGHFAFAERPLELAHELQDFILECADDGRFDSP